jgi:brefeldin A-resistance guanine nucleotide exchange factor 1
LSFRTDIGLFSSLAFLLGGGSSNDSTLLSGKQPTSEEQEAIKAASLCIEECHLEQLLQETKFLIIDSLNELLKALIYTCQISPDSSKLDRDAAVFCLELLVKVVLQNRDRVTIFWPIVRLQFDSILLHANEKTFFIERTCIGLLRIAARILRREELATEVSTSLHMLLVMKPHILHALSSEIAYGLHELLRTNAANIHKSEDWFILFCLLEAVGAGARPPPILQLPIQNSSTNKYLHQSHSTINAESDSECSDCVAPSVTDKGYTSDSEIYRRSDYIVVSHNDLEIIRNQYEKFSRHDHQALNKSCEILSFLIRDIAYVTQENIEYCIHCIRTFIETTIIEQIDKQKSKLSTTNHRNLKQIRKATSTNSLNNENFNEQIKQSRSDYDNDDDIQETIKQEYQTLALQLLDLMHTLHMGAPQIYKQIPIDQTISNVLWYKCWCPILQG